MSQPHFLGTFVSVVLATFALTTVSYGQSTQSSQNAAQAPSKSQTAVPVTMTECEGTNNCATWTFLGGSGNGHWPSGEIANLSVERSDANSVVIRRADSTGVSAGLTAVYTGTRHDDRVGGEYTSSWPGHWDNKSGNWYATVEKNPIGPPSVMHWCALHCGTWTLDKGAPFDKPHYGSEASGQIVVVENFTRESVVMKRTDYGPYPGTAVLTGQLSSDGNSVVAGKIEWTYHPCCGTSVDNFTAAWGTALNTVPASDAERDRGKPPQPRPQVVVRPAVCVPWFFTIVCG
jgi:hypothetical protein